ncbi:uncharacterized protein KY384_004464 [Bacidia gigantensis]|uniref:uncharacterized protein n=1 Tax=Bacidia gigantensis TaxID=2732470 RepID=UPI001D04B57E|nr:uncharacterized protein KY384_004464 [Bacidia gigantensis]KAG8531107.1 hypothetical protein KY384_004464 [Bacidia gigantensis]
MPSQTPTVFSSTELAYLHSSLAASPPIRPDARAPTTFRPLIAETDLVPFANGSARLCFADGTEGIVGVKAEIETTVTYGSLRGGDRIDPIKQDDAESLRLGEHDSVEVTIDIPGQRDDDPTIHFLCQMIQESFVTDRHLQRRLYINDHWHWKLSIDILLLSQPLSYPLPLLSLSTHLALLSTRLPALISRGEEDPLFDDDWDAALPLYTSPSPTSTPRITNTILSQQTATTKNSRNKPPVHLLVISVADNIFFDPSPEELAVADSVVVITLTTKARKRNEKSKAGEDDAKGGEGVEVLGIRTLDPPARGSASSFAALAQQSGQPGGEGGGNEDEEGVWRPKVGGMKRAVLKKMTEMCIKRRGVGEEVMEGLESFARQGKYQMHVL